MNVRLNKVELIDCVYLMAKQMKLTPLPSARAVQLIEHVLFDKEFNGVKGKDGWGCFLSHLLTEREIRNLMMAHSATRISSYNKKSEPGYNNYGTRNLCQKFEIALLDKVIIPTVHDSLDSWEKSRG